MTESDLVQLLADSVTVSNLVSNRVYFDAPAQSVDKQLKPYIVLSLVSAAPKNYVGASTTMDARRVTADCYATTAQVARSVSDAVRSVFELSGVMLGENPSGYDGITKLYYRSLDFSFHLSR